MTTKATTYRILVLAGDHVGPEVMTEALKVLRTLEDCRPHIRFDLTIDLVGGCSIDKHGVPITAAVLDLAKKSDAVLLGSVGGPEWESCWPNPESGILQLRQHLDAFANIRPCRFFAPDLVDLSPIKADVVRGTRFTVVRENCGGAYFGEKAEDAERGSDLWAYTTGEVERLARVSAAVAKMMGRKADRNKKMIAGDDDGGPAAVWSADKANVLASGRIWRRATATVFAREFPDVKLRHQLADSMAMLMVSDPRRFNGVIHTDNTFGDILSDISGAITGTIGVLPSASVSGVPGQGRCCGIYEPVHGSAPDISGNGLANPVAQILSAAMMLRYSLDLQDEADLIESAASRVLSGQASGGLGIRTRDLGGTATTEDVGDAVCASLRSLMGA